MRKLALEIATGISAFVLSIAAHAVTVSPQSISLNPGGSATVTVTNVSGSVSVTNSNTSVATVTKVSTYGYRINALLAGAATVTFKDRKNSVNVAVTVSPTTSATLNGRLLASNCFQCHGTNGSGGFDKLAGSTEVAILDDLRKFAQGRDDPTGIMAAHAMGYTDAQLQGIAKYLSTLR